MGTAKDYKVYGSGGKQRNRRLDDGLRAMQIQTDRQVNALQKLEAQNRLQSQAYISGLESKAKKEYENRKLLNKLEDETPRKMRADSIKRNAEITVKSLKDQATENDKLAKVWAGLSPTLSKQAENLYNATEKYLGHTDAIEKFNDMQSNGTLEQSYKMFDSVKGQAGTMDVANEQYKAYERGDDEVGNYLTEIQKIRNPYLKTLLFEDLKKNFDGLETHFTAFLKSGDGSLYNRKDILSHYQYRALEWLEQYGIKPDSEIGFKVQQLFRNKGATAQNQLELGHQHATHTNVIESAVSEIGALNANPPDLANYKDDVKSYEAAMEAHKEQTNALWIKAVNSQHQLPLVGSNGTYAINKAPNMRNSIVAFAENALRNPRYSSGEGSTNGFELFKEEVLGVTKDNPYGYLIPGADPNSKKKTDRILGKFPMLEEQLLEAWQTENKKKLNIATALQDDKLKAEAKAIEIRLNNKEFKGQMGWDGEFWKVWASNKGNKYVNRLMADYIGLGGDNIDYHSNIIQSYRAGDIVGVMNAYAIMDDKGALGPKDQNLEYIVQNLEGLATYFNTDVTGLDDIIEDQSKAMVAEVIKHDVTGRLKTMSQSGMEEKLTATILATYTKAQGDTPKEKYQNTITLVKSMLGYDGDVLGKFDNNQVRGWGEFRHKLVNGNVVFTNTALSGRDFNGITENEIESMLSRKQNTIFDDSAEARKAPRLDKLSRIVSYANRNYNATGQGVSTQDIYDYVVTGTTENELINHLVKDHLDGNSVSEFKRSLEPLLDAKFYNKVVMMDGDEWCNYKFGPGSANLSPKDKPLGVCIEKIEKDFGIPAWEVLVDPKVKEKLNQFLQERN